jgi:hypothetical protein
VNQGSPAISGVNVVCTRGEMAGIKALSLEKRQFMVSHAIPRRPLLAQDQRGIFRPRNAGRRLQRCDLLHFRGERRIVQLRVNTPKQFEFIEL